MSGAKPVLVIGATRGTGRLAIDFLLREGRHVRALARDPDKAKAELGDSVEVVRGDLTRPETLADAIRGAGAVVLTAGVTKRPAPEKLVKATEFDGTVNVLKAAKAAGFGGRLLYMSAVGTTRASLLAFLLNRIKGNTLKWRAEGERAIRASGLDYTIVHAGILNDDPGREHALRITQRRLPLSPRYRLSRADAAEVLVHALAEPKASRATIDVVWTRGEPTRDWNALFRYVHPDPPGPDPDDASDSTKTE
jgi:uncharacterized protein YbjT (DUF2867 family)